MFIYLGWGFLMRLSDNEIQMAASLFGNGVDLDTAQKAAVALNEGHTAASSSTVAEAFQQVQDYKKRVEEEIGDLIDIHLNNL